MYGLVRAVGPIQPHCQHRLAVLTDNLKQQPVKRAAAEWQSVAQRMQEVIKHGKNAS